MRRPFVYPGQIPLDTDLLNTNKDMLLALGKIAKVLFGTSLQVSTDAVATGLACTATSPASLGVVVGAGEIYQIQTIDSTDYGSLGTDTGTLVKQGTLMASQTLTGLSAPATAGQSIVYLIEAQVQSQDNGSVVLSYYNVANPSQPFAGPNNAGTAQPTYREDVVVLQVKAGTPATTGSQVAPSADTGWTPLWAVTVAYGQSTITSANIATASGAPFITDGLPQKLSTATAAAIYAPLASPTFTGAPSAPTPNAGDNTTKLATTAFVRTAIQGKFLRRSYFVATAAYGASYGNGLTTSGSYTVPSDISFIVVKMIGGGGSGGSASLDIAGTPAANGVGGGGAAANYVEKKLTVADLGGVGAVVNYTIGSGGKSVQPPDNLQAVGQGASTVFGPATSFTVTAAGGQGGSGGFGVNSTGASPSVSGANGDLVVQGSAGAPATVSPTLAIMLPGTGGGNVFGPGAQGVPGFTGSRAGANATCYGSGGAGAYSNGGSATFGGTGGLGLLIIEEYA